MLIWDDTEPIEIHGEELNLPQFELTRDPEARSDCKEAYKTGKIVDTYLKLMAGINMDIACPNSLIFKLGKHYATRSQSM